MSMAELEHPTTEQQVDDWRLEQLLAAGYPVRAAEQLAVRHDIDLHQAVELVKKRGCNPWTATEIML